MLMQRIPYNLSQITIYAAMDVDNLIKGIEADLPYLKQFKFTFGEFKAPSSAYSVFDFNFDPNLQMPLIKTFQKTSDRKLEDIQDLALRSHLLYNEIDSINFLSKNRLENLRDFLVQASIQYGLET